jgi:hypothetical protein
MKNKRIRNSLVIGIILLFVGGNVILTINVSGGAPPEIDWEKTFYGSVQGGDSWNSRRGYAVQQTKDGGYIVLGKSYQHSLEDGDLWLLKTDKVGNKEWDSYLPTIPSQGYWGDGNSIQQTTDGGFIITTDKNMVIKTDINGIVQWNKTYSLGTQWKASYPPSVQQTSDGGYIVVCTKSYSNYLYDYNKTIIVRNCWYDQNGEKIPYPDFEQLEEFQIIYSGTNTVISKINNNGIEIWNKTYGLIFKPQQNLTVIFENVEIWSALASMNKLERYSSNTEGISIKLASDVGYIILTRTDELSPGNKSYCVVKTDSVGKEQWNRTLEPTLFGASQFVLSSFSQTSDSGYIITGSVMSNYWQNSDVMLLKTDSNFNILWNKTFGGREKAGGFSVQQTTDGGYFIGGGLSEDTEGMPWLIKTDGNGNELWNITIGSSLSGLGNALQTKDGGYIVVGTQCFGEYCEDKEIFLAKLKPGSSQGGNQPGNNNNTTGDTKGTPGFELVFVLCAITVAILVWRKKRSI